MKKEWAILGLIMASVWGCSHFKRSAGDSAPTSLKSLAASAGTISQIHLPIKKYTLDNGLRVLVYENHQLPIFTYYTFFDVGRAPRRVGYHRGDPLFGTHDVQGNRGATGQGNLIVLSRAVEAASTPTPVLTRRFTTSLCPLTCFPKLSIWRPIACNTCCSIPRPLNPNGKSYSKSARCVMKNRDEGRLFLKMMQSVFSGTPYGGSVIGEKLKI